MPSTALLPFYQNQSLDASINVCATYVKLGHKCTNILKDEAHWAKMSEYEAKMLRQLLFTASR